MTDIVERLRRVGIGAQVNAIEHDRQAGKDGADEIERLREALREIQKRAEQQSTMPFDRHADYFRIARAALGEGRK